ncbi:MAG: flagellin [Myxococcota bacterium]|nr:flagellin [Myxococcota bacterium]
MSIAVHNNSATSFAQNRLSRYSVMLNDTFEVLSTGSRVNKSSDDPTAAAVATHLDHRIRAQGMAKQNANAAISLLQTTEGGVQQVVELLHRLRELATRAGTSSLTPEDRAASNLEFNGLINEIDRIAQSTEFQGQPMLATSIQLTVQIGMDNRANDRITLTIDSSLRVSSLNLSGLGIDTIVSAQTALQRLSAAMVLTLNKSSLLGATMNRLERSILSLESDIEASSAAEGRIMDADFAEATSMMSRLRVLIEASSAVIGQANSIPELAINLVR